MDQRPEGIVRSQHMSEGELRAVKALAAVCNAHDGLDLKLNLSPGPVVGSVVNHFLYYGDGEVVGFCSLDGGGPPEMEVCGMVHPEHRRSGIGTALFEAAVAEWKPQGVAHFLLICEEASAAGRAFMDKIGAKYEFAEHHMEMDAGDAVEGGSAGPGERVTLERATAVDANHIARIMSSAFGGPPEKLVGRIQSDMYQPGERFYLARLAATEEPVGTLKAILWEGKVGIYAFGVLAEYRGRGIGRQILSQLLRIMESEGYKRFALEVETTNESAGGLYHSFGFKTTTTYGYYRLEI